jgi:hypothetical protein
MEEPKKVKIINNGVVMYRPWTLDLLTPEQLQSWEKFKDEEMEGRSDKEKTAIRRTPTAIRLSRWATAKGYGVDPVLEDFKSGKISQLPIDYVPVRKFVLPLGETILSVEQAKHFEKFKKRKIYHELQPGESKKRFTVEGFLEFEEVGGEKPPEALSAEEKVEDELAEIKDFNKKTTEELRELAGSMGLPNLSGAKKKELVKLVRAKRRDILREQASK